MKPIGIRAVITTNGIRYETDAPIKPGTHDAVVTYVTVERPRRNRRRTGKRR